MGQYSVVRVSTARYTISVRCPDLGGVRFSEVANVLVLR